MWLLVVALFGLLIPNGLFIYWLFTEFHSLGAVLHDKLAMAFMIDAFLAVAILAVHFARSPVGKFGWPWFVFLSLIGQFGLQPSVLLVAQHATCNRSAAAA